MAVRYGIGTTDAQLRAWCLSGLVLSRRLQGLSTTSIIFIEIDILTCSSAILLWMSYNHNETYGPKSTHARNAEGSTQKDIEEESIDLSPIPRNAAQMPTKPAPVQSHAGNQAAGMDGQDGPNTKYEGV